MNESFLILQKTQSDEKFSFRHTDRDNHNRMFNHGCDVVVNKRFDEEFGEVMGRYC